LITLTVLANFIGGLLGSWGDLGQAPPRAAASKPYVEIR
jgi:hypothetical protein